MNCLHTGQRRASESAIQPPSRGMPARRHRSVSEPAAVRSSPPAVCLAERVRQVPATRLSRPQLEAAAARDLPLRLLNECASRRWCDPPVTRLATTASTSVYSARFTMPDGSTADGVYKAETREDRTRAHVTAEQAGIDPMRPNWTLRNLATSKLDARLGLDVIVRTSPALNEYTEGHAELGCLMDKAPGVPPLQVGGVVTVPVGPETAATLHAHPQALSRFARDRGFFGGRIEGDLVRLDATSVPRRQEFQLTPEEDRAMDDEREDELSEALGLRAIGRRTPGRLVLSDGFPLARKATNEIDLRNPIVRRNLTRLQWHDFLAGQVDRHDANYHVAPDGRVLGFDNDVAFGRWVNHAGERPMGKLPGMPDVIDPAAAQAFLALRPEHVRSDCQDLAPDEIDATIRRLLAIQAKIRSFGDAPDEPGSSQRLRGRILADGAAWSTPEADALLGICEPPREDVGPATYVARMSDWQWVLRNRRPEHEPFCPRADLDALAELLRTQPQQDACPASDSVAPLAPARLARPVVGPAHLDNIARFWEEQENALRPAVERGASRLLARPGAAVSPSFSRDASGYGDFALAESFARAALAPPRAAGSAASRHRLLVRALLMQGKAVEALEAATQASALAPLDPFFLLATARANLQLGDWAAAALALQAHDKLGVLASSLERELVGAMLMHSQGDTAAASAAIASAVVRAEGNPRRAGAIAQAFAWIGDAANAIATMDGACASTRSAAADMNAVSGDITAEWAFAVLSPYARISGDSLWDALAGRAAAFVRRMPAPPQSPSSSPTGFK